MKKKLLPLTIIAVVIALIAAACGSSSNSGSTSQTVSVGTVPDTTLITPPVVEPSIVPEVTTSTSLFVEPTVTTEESLVPPIVPTTTVAPEVSLPTEPPNRDNLRTFRVTFPHKPISELSKTNSEGVFSLYGGWDLKASITPPGEDVYYFDLETLPQNTGDFRIVDGEKYFYVAEVDEYYPCWQVMGEASIISNNGYCSNMLSPQIRFLDSDGYYVDNGVVWPNYLEILEEEVLSVIKFQSALQSNFDNLGFITPAYEPPEVLPSEDREVLLHLRYKDEFITTTCKNVGERYLDIAPPGVYDVPPNIARKRATFWIHEDNVCRNGIGGYVNEETGEYITTRLCKGKVVDGFTCDYGDLLDGVR